MARPWSIARALHEIDARAVGAELGAELRVNMTILDFDTLRARTKARFQDASAIIWGLRLVKTDVEIALMEHAAAIGEQAYARSLATVRAGERDRAWSGFKVALPACTGPSCAARLAAEVALAGGRVAFVIMTSGPGSYYRSNGAPSDRTLVAGDFLFVDLGVHCEGYHSDFNRCLVVGQPTPEQRALQDRVLAVSEAAARYLVPGVAAHEVYARVLDDCRRAGLVIAAPGRIGHGIGLGVTEPPHISAEDPTLLEAGMVVTIEPAVQREDGLYCAECVYVVGAGGGHRLNQAPAVLMGTGPQRAWM